MHNIFRHTFNYFNNNRDQNKFSLDRNITDSFDIHASDNYVYQGICAYKDLLFITSYDCTYKLNSKITIVRNQAIIHETILNTNSHVGGIAIDPKNKIVWVTDRRGCISGYELNNVIKSDSVIPIFDKIKVADDLINIYGINSVAYLTIYKNKLYVGNYNTKDKSIIKVLSINKDGSIDLENVRVISSPSYIQGITFISKNNKDYLFISSSYGTILKSNIKICEYNSSIKDLRDLDMKIIKLPPMLEQIYIKDNKLYTIFESNAKKYRNIFIKNKDINIYQIDDYI